MLADLPGAIRAAAASARSVPATCADLRRSIGRLTHAATCRPHEVDDDPPGPHADDWRGLVRPFAAAGRAAGYVQPRRLQKYRADFLPAPAGHLAEAHPAG